MGYTGYDGFLTKNGEVLMPSFAVDLPPPGVGIRARPYSCCDLVPVQTCQIDSGIIQQATEQMYSMSISTGIISRYNEGLLHHKCWK